MISIRVRGVRLSVRVAALAMLLCAVLFGSGQTAVRGFLALLAHEISHLIVMLLLGEKPESVELTPFGGMMYREDERGGAKPFLIAFAGVAGSLLLSAMLFRADADFSRLSFTLALFNLLPAYPLDGGRMLYALLQKWVSPRRLLRALCHLSMLLSVLLTLLALYAALRGQINLTLLFAAPYIGYAACQNRSAQLGRLVGRRLTLIRALGGGAARVELRAAIRVPDQMELLRFLQGEKYHALLLVDEESGDVTRVVGEGELTRRILE